jgi:hypothetical protein
MDAKVMNVFDPANYLEEKLKLFFGERQGRTVGYRAEPCAQRRL